MRDFIGRGAAGKFKDKEKGYDLFIPILLQNDKLTYLFTQVKNKAQNLNILKTKNSMKENSSYFKLIHMKFISIFMSLKENKQSGEMIEGHLILQGLNSFNLNTDEIDILNKIIDCYRNHFLSIKYDNQIIQQVTVGSYGLDKSF